MSLTREFFREFQAYRAAEAPGPAFECRVIIEFATFNIVVVCVRDVRQTIDEVNFMARIFLHLWTWIPGSRGQRQPSTGMTAKSSRIHPAARRPGSRRRRRVRWSCPSSAGRNGLRCSVRRIRWRRWRTGIAGDRAQLGAVGVALVVHRQRLVPRARDLCPSRHGTPHRLRGRPRPRDSARIIIASVPSPDNSVT